MNHTEFYELLAELLEADESEINGRSMMKDLPNWDSLAVLSFIAMADCELDVVVDATKITGVSDDPYMTFCPQARGGCGLDRQENSSGVVANLVPGLGVAAGKSSDYGGTTVGVFTGLRVIVGLRVIAELLNGITIP